MVCASADRRHRRLSLVAVFVAALAWTEAGAVLVKPMNVEEMIRTADRIFRGQVLRVEAEQVPGRPLALVTHVRVEERLKGDPADVVVIRQRARKGPRGRVVPLAEGFPQFRADERVLVFLSGENDGGFSMPVGFGQGVFRLQTGKADPSRWMAVNGFGNEGLFRNVSKTQTREVAQRVATKAEWRASPTLMLGALLELIRAQAGGTR